MDVTRKASEPVEDVVPEAPKQKVQTPVSDSIEVPFTSFTTQNHKPFTSDYFKLGDNWDSGYKNEIETIERYLKHKVENGDLADTLSSIKRELKNIEKINGMKDEERTVVKVGTMAAYVKFLLETEGIKLKMKPYGKG